MRIVITDGYTLNPGDLDWKSIEELGEISYYDRTDGRDTIGRCREADIIITNKTPISEEVITAAKKLRLIAVTATGYNIIDTIAARNARIPVCNVPEYGTDSVAQHTIALLLELTNQVGLHAASVGHGDWVKSPDWCYSKTPIIELRGKVLGIVGFGRIGRQVGNIAAVLGMKVIFFDPSQASEPGRASSLDEIFSASDVISLHCPLTKDNQGFINKKVLSNMKPDSFLINTSRGQLVNEVDLADALKNNQIAGAALDVLTKEPPPAAHPLQGLSNCIITPHIAWISKAARERIMHTTAQNIRTALEGQPQNVVNP